jgi:RNA polymerase sigma-70 factor, ECF subfamily
MDSQPNTPSTAATPDENDLMLRRAIQRAKEGDTSALHYLYVRFANDVHRHVRRIGLSLHDAEDVTQNVFAKLMTAMSRYEQRGAPFRAWILKVARNAALDHIRSQRLVPCEEVRMSDEGEDDISLDLRLALREALKLLPEDQRQILILRHVGGLTPGQIARLLGKSEASIHGLHYRGRHMLQDALRELQAAPATRAA